MKRPRVLVVDIFQGQDGLWYLRGKARGGVIVAGSEGYTRKDSVKRAAKRNWPTAKIREVT